MRLERAREALTYAYGLDAVPDMAAALAELEQAEAALGIARTIADAKGESGYHVFVPDAVRELERALAAFGSGEGDTT